MEMFYSNCQDIALDCFLFIDGGMTIPVSAGFYSNGIDSFETDFTGKVIAITTCVVVCTLELTFTTSTPPTTLGGTDGTITMEFTTSAGPSTYTLNGVPKGAAVSPLVVTGLEAAVEYTIAITDSAACTKQAVMTLGQSATLFDADWLQATYEFTTGTDLDTRSRIALPDVGMNIQANYLGWGRNGGYDPLNGYLTGYNDGKTADPLNFLILFGGDNVGNGFESILVNINRFKELFPGETQITIDLRAFWYNHLPTNPGLGPINAAVTLWKDADPPVGKPVHGGCGGYCWTYLGAADTKPIDSVPTYITDINKVTTDPLTGGVRIATLKYNLNTSVTILDNSDTTTPEITGTPF